MLVFYQDSSNNIICANFTSSLGTSTLTLTKSVQIAAGTTAHPSSSLVAVYLGADASSWRVYYQATNGTLLELVGLAKGWKAGAVLATADAVGGSPLSLSMVNAPEMNIFYVDSSTSNLYSISYSGGWQTRMILLSQAQFSWLTNRYSFLTHEHSNHQLERIRHLTRCHTRIRAGISANVLHWD